MSPLIKIPGKTGAAAKPATKRAPKAAPKPAAKAKAKPKPAAKAKPAAKRATPASSNGHGDARIARDGRVLRTPKDLDPKVLDDFEGQLSDAGERVKEAKAEHDAAIDAVHEVVVQAQEVGIPMAIIEDVTGISRQWLYKMGQFKDRTPGNGKTKPAPKAKAAPKPKAKPAATAKRATSAANKTAKRSGGSPAIKLH